MPDKSLAQRINLRASEKLIPLSVFIELTHRCNLNCYYCYQRNFGPTPELDEKAWGRTFGELADSGTLNLTFSGGEPLLRDDFFIILKQARRYEFGVSVISNGYLITSNLASAFADYGVMDVGISLHACTAALHDKLAGQTESFARALAAVRSLVKHGVKVLIKHSVSAANFGEYKHLQKLADDEGCGIECDPGILPQRQGEASPYTLSPKQLNIFFRDMGFKPQALCNSGRDETTLYCDAGRGLCGIAPDGKVYPCIILPVLLGTLTRQPFQKIWSGEEAAGFRCDEKYLDGECLSCEVNQLCSRCHGFAWMESGNWKGKSRSLCERANALRLDTPCLPAAGPQHP